MCLVFNPTDITFGKRQLYSTIDRIIATSLKDCMKGCHERRRCLSINYAKDVRLCELNSKRKGWCPSKCVQENLRFVMIDRDEWSLVRQTSTRLLYI